MDEKLPPQTIKDKFVTGTLDSLDYSAFIFVAIQAGVAQARNATPEFHHGAAGYGRYYWHTYADYVDENLWVEFLLPTALHQDSRYYTLGRGGFAKRLGTLCHVQPSREKIVAMRPSMLPRSSARVRPPASPVSITPARSAPLPKPINFG